VIKDASTGRSRGFGFVSYDTAQAAQAAILSLDGLRVSGYASVASCGAIVIVFRLSHTAGVGGHML
jgi:RNA recognition motif-containing protein